MSIYIDIDRLFIYIDIDRPYLTDKYTDLNY